MDALYIQTIVKQEIKIGAEGIFLTIPECKITNVILSKDIFAVKENINNIISQLKINYSKDEKYFTVDEVNLANEFKIGESKEIKIHIYTFDSQFLYKIHIMKTEVGYGLNI